MARADHSRAKRGEFEFVYREYTTILISRSYLARHPIDVGPGLKPSIDVMALSPRSPLPPD